jgi:hypothetical protein
MTVHYRCRQIWASRRPLRSRNSVGDVLIWVDKMEILWICARQPDTAVGGGRQSKEENLWRRLSTFPVRNRVTCQASSLQAFTEIIVVDIDFA